MTSNAKSFGIPAAAIVAFVLMALLGIGLVLYAVFGLSDTGAQAPVPPTAVGVAIVQPSMTAVILPTVISQPSVVPATPTAVNTEAAPPTALAPTMPTTPTEIPGSSLTAAQVANIRSGPGTTYPVIGRLEAGKAVPVIGRDSSATWYVIADAAGTQGYGWVTSAVVSFSGDAQGLPVIAAPPPLPTTAPPTAAASKPAPTSPPPPPPASAQGLVGTLNLCQARTTYAVDERICVIEKIYNPTDRNIDYGIFGVNAANLTGGPNWFQSSWTGALTIAPGCTGPVGTCGGQWEDGFKLSAGTYQFTLSICYSSVATCQGGGDWETLTAPITVVVQ